LRNKAGAINTARRLVLDHDLRPPVDLNHLLAEFSIDLVEWDFPPDIAGMLVYEEGAWTIGVNRAHSETRKRFTIAHEIMHYVMHRGTRFCHSGGKDYREVQANAGAAELLMPTAYMSQMCLAMGFDEVAEYCQVSKRALNYHLMALRD
jgi:Zn-dependent peptidase ImmA (M78 family)